ncbi:hypothetical protein PSEUDO8AS_50164 [Pseudomonas sp. 8AS]|nr:hypothetical protein PSEUDO8AS_50164 [Pseudomonas sp. 8AS]
MQLGGFFATDDLHKVPCDRDRAHLTRTYAYAVRQDKRSCFIEITPGMKVLVQRFEVLEGDFTNLIQLGFSGHLAIRRCDRIDQLSDCSRCAAVATSELIVHQRIFERAERVGAVLAGAGLQSRADLRRRRIVLTAVSPIKILCSGLIPLQGCGLHRCHLSSCCFDDKAKPLREWRWGSPAYTEMHYAFASFFLIPSELPQRPLTRAASKRCALSLTRHCFI